MSYLNQELVFEEDMIYFLDKSNNRHEVMMSWEDNLMKASADFICQNGGHILEIGFGMGISANYIQQNNILSHTVVENHPDVIPKALEWAAEKPNVTVITGSWYDVLDDLATYDGVFYDTYGDTDIQFFTSSLPTLVNPGAKTTWWNTLPNSESIFDFDNIQYQEFVVSPPENSYFNSSKYYLPKKQF